MNHFTSDNSVARSYYQNILNGRIDNNIVANATLFLLKQYFTAAMIINPPCKLKLRDFKFFFIIEPIVMKLGTDT